MISYLRSIPESAVIRGSQLRSLIFLIAGLAVVFLMYIIGQWPLWMVIELWREEGFIDDYAWSQFLESHDISAVGLSSNIGFFLMLVPFITMIIGLLIYVNYAYKIHPLKLINSSRVRWSRIGFGALVFFCLLVAGDAISYLVHPQNLTFQWNKERMLGQILLVICILPIQSSCEELIFRGFYTSTCESSREFSYFRASYKYFVIRSNSWSKSGGRRTWDLGNDVLLSHSWPLPWSNDNSR